MKNTQFKISKSTIQVYYLRPEGHHCGWADISLDIGENAGRLSISSDYGNWAFYWGSCGCPFKEFLISLDMYYMSGKMRESNWFDHSTTMKEMKRIVLEERRDEALSAEKARELFDEVSTFDEHDQMEAFKVAMWHSELLGFFDYSPPIMTDVSPSFKRFFKTTWQAFIGQLKEETKLQTVSK